MRTQLYIDGELRTVDIEDGRITTVNEEPKEVEIKTGWERGELMQRYYMVDGTSQPETYHPEDTARYENADYFSSPALAADIARAQTIWRRLMRWQAENDNPVYWGNDGIESEHFSIYCDHFTEQLTVATSCYSQNAFDVYFSTEEVAYRALEIFHDDLLWLFTEFRYKLDGDVE